MVNHYLSDTRLNITIDYELHLSNKLKFPGYTRRQTNLADWYPFIPPYKSGSGWIVHDPAGVGENLVYDISDYKVSLQLINASKNVLVAASGQGNITTSGYSYEVQSVRNFSCSISEDYSQIKKTFGAVEVDVFVFPTHQQEGQVVVDTIGQALGYYGSTFGAYKNKSLTMGRVRKCQMGWNMMDFSSWGRIFSIPIKATLNHYWFLYLPTKQLINGGMLRLQTILLLEPWLDEITCNLL